ncbi:MAG: acyltransferase [Actinomycetaceae bacterium]|nr:acyltransferase [Actinomycetaceae bacterium]
MGQLSVAQAFDPRRNSIDFLRWLLAFLVIFSHAGPIAGFYGGEDLGIQISSEQSLGGVAVGGFFFFSGFLITKSRMGRSTIWRYFWRRCLRIFPAFWAALAVTVTVFAPLAWHSKHGTFSGYWQAVTEAPRTYFLNNMFLELGQRNIAELGDTVPYFLGHQARDWNGSAWTLKYEFLCYIIVGLLGLFGALSSRFFATAFAATCIGLNFLQWSGAVDLASVNPIFADPYLLMFAAPFGFGMIFALYGEKIMVDDRVAFGMLAFGLCTYAAGGWNAIGQYGFQYFLMWFGIRVPITGWAKHGDFSYGIYIFAWPLMYLATFFQYERHGWFVYHATIVVLVHVMAFISWHLIEKPAMSLKNWTPRWLGATIAVWTPAAERVKAKIVAPNFSSTRYAAKVREERRLREERAAQEERMAREERKPQEVSAGDQ